MRYLFWKLWRNDQAFTLIELLVVFCLFVVFIVMTSGMIFHLSRAADIHANVIEKNETFLSTLDQLKMLIKHGRPLALTQNNYRLRIAMGKNIVEVYPKDSSLLLMHLQSANPIAEHCCLSSPPFELRKLENRKIQVNVSLDFLFSDYSEEHLDLQFLSWCEDEEL